MNLMGALIVQMSLFWTFFDLIQSSINLREYIILYTFGVICTNNDH